MAKQSVKGARKALKNGIQRARLFGSSRVPARSVGDALLTAPHRLQTGGAGRVYQCPVLCLHSAALAS